LPGTYQVTVTDNNDCTAVGEVTIEEDIIEIIIDALPSCLDQGTGTAMASVTGGTAPYEYTWDTLGTNSPNLENAPSGVYTLLVTDSDGCTSEADVFIDAYPEVLVPFEVIDVQCFGYSDGALILGPSGNGFSFSLDSIFFQPTTEFQNLTPGDHLLYVQDSLGCIHTQSFFVGEPPPILVALPEDTTLILGDSLLIPSFTNIVDSIVYQWTPPDYLNCDDCERVVSRPLYTTTYTLVVTDENDCTASDDILIMIDKERKVFIPNAFSPNGDGTNDVFMIYANGGVEEVLTFRVFDRWGELVWEDNNFQPNNPAHGWNGIFKGEVMNPGVLVFMAEIRFVDGLELLYKGDVTLLK